MTKAYDEQALRQLLRIHEHVEINGADVHLKSSVADLPAGALDPWLLRHEKRLQREPAPVHRPRLGLLLKILFRPDTALIQLRHMTEGIVISPNSAAAAHPNADAVAVTREDLVLWRNSNVLWKYARTDIDGPRPALVFLHSGGWFAGRPTGSDVFLTYIAAESGAVVFDLDYSLAPEHRYPHAVNEAYAAVEHIRDHAREYGIDPARIAIGGASAGANLAAAATLKAKTEGSRPVALQILLNAVVLVGTTSPPGLRWDPSEFVFTEKTEKSLGRMTDPAKDRRFQTMARAYRGRSDGDDPLLSPALATDLTGLPRALIITSEMDNLRPQAEYYAGQLAQAGVPVRVVRHRGVTHDTAGMFDDVPSGEAMALEIVAELQGLNPDPMALDARQ
ncbi:alpha/beta hydrolase [Nocardia africana]